MYLVQPLDNEVGIYIFYDGASNSCMHQDSSYLLLNKQKDLGKKENNSMKQTYIFPISSLKDIQVLNPEKIRAANLLNWCDNALH